MADGVLKINIGTVDTPDWRVVGGVSSPLPLQSKVLVIDKPVTGLVYAFWYVEQESLIIGYTTRNITGGVVVATTLTVTPSLVTGIVAANTWVTAATSGTGTPDSATMELVFQPTGG